MKPHGALYNRVVHDEEQAAAVVDGRAARRRRAARSSGCPARACWSWPREAGLPVVTEAFADRAYTAEGTLVPRGEDGAVVTDPDAVVERSVGLARLGVVDLALRAAGIAVAARSLCLHGDTPGAVDLARRVRAALEASGVRVEAFA